MVVKESESSDPKQHNMKKYGGEIEVYFHVFLNSAVGRDGQLHALAVLSPSEVIPEFLGCECM
jgi:hypothetical protein